MEPKIQDGDLVLIRQQDHYDINDYIFVIHNDLPKLKKIIKKDSQIMLESVNRFFDDVTIEPYDQTKVIGSVKRVIKSF
jgi:phage repressor protein C with HTH and peptisase S24 domain